MNFLIIPAFVAFVALPAVIQLTMRQIPSPSLDHAPRCYGLDGRSSEICCDDPGHVESGCVCGCACHHDVILSV